MNIKLKEVLDKVEFTYPTLGETARLVLAVAAATRLEREHPLAVILIGGPSSGKTSLLMPLSKGEAGSCLADSVIRIDDFTPASLVSHATNKSPEQLAKIDLLPQLKDKVVVVKELAPMFTGNEEELAKKFGILASVLDGEGYISSSGSYGRRGYTEKITFSLLGAVTHDVLSQKVYNTLSAIGPRFCFWEMPKRNHNPSKWKGPGVDRKQIEIVASTAMSSFVNSIFEQNPPASLKREAFYISDEIQIILSQIAYLMSLLRSKFNYEREIDGSYSTTEPTTESPDRAYRYLEQIVIGSAIIDDRLDVTDSDLRLALGVAIGSAIPKLRRLAKFFMESDAKRTTRDIAFCLKFTEDTASKYADQLKELGVIEKVNFDGTTEWDLKQPFKELRKLLGTQDPVKTEVIQETFVNI